MSRFLIEIPHEAEKTACLRAVKVLQETGSHFLTHADYGCLDGEHKAWIIVDVDSKNEARMIKAIAAHHAAGGIRKKLCHGVALEAFPFLFFSAISPVAIRGIYCK